MNAQTHDAASEDYVKFWGKTIGNYAENFERQNAALERIARAAELRARRRSLRRVIREDYAVLTMLALVALALTFLFSLAITAGAEAKTVHCHRGYVRHGHRCVKVKPKPKPKASAAPHVFLPTPEQEREAEWEAYRQANQVAPSSSEPSPDAAPPGEEAEVAAKPGPFIYEKPVYCEGGWPTWEPGAHTEGEYTEKEPKLKASATEKVKHARWLNIEGIYGYLDHVSWAGRTWFSIKHNGGAQLPRQGEEAVETAPEATPLEPIWPKVTAQALGELNWSKEPHLGSEWWGESCVPGEVIRYQEYVIA